MTLIQLAVAGIFIVLIARYGARLSEGAITPRVFVWWEALWVAGLLFTLDPQLSSVFARGLGVGRGADIAFFVSIVLLFTLVARLYLRCERLERENTELAATLARELHAQENARQFRKQHS